MKNFLAFIFIISALGIGVYGFKDKIPDVIKNRLDIAVKERNWSGLADAVFFGKCSQPFLYSIGNIDPNFNISQEEFLAEAKKAENIWDSQYGKKLFAYSPDAQFKINLVFDERQQQTLEAETLEQKLEKLKLSDAGLKKQYDAVYADYSKKVDEYNALAKKYENKLKDYNKEVKYWNEKGGAPPAEFEKLQEEKDELESMYKNLEKKRKEINNLSKELNALVSKENQIIGNYNAAVNTYQSKYGGSREFEKGVYNGEEINIYQFKEEADLELTIAHELGHALGIDHVENPQSLMYYLLAQQDMDAPKLSAEDLAAVKVICSN